MFPYRMQGHLEIQDNDQKIKKMKPTDSEDDLGVADKLLDVFSICFAVATFH